MQKKVDTSDKELLKNIFFSSLRLADPVTKLIQLKFTKPPGRLFLSRLVKVLEDTLRLSSPIMMALPDGIVILPENEECKDLGFKVFKASIQFHRLLAWKPQNI